MSRAPRGTKQKVRRATKFYLVKEIPAEVDRELRSAARGMGIPLRRAFVAVLRAVPLREAALAGQRVAARGGADNGGGVSVGFQLPALQREALAEVEHTLGLAVGMAGRLILVSRAGKLAETIHRGLGPTT